MENELVKNMIKRGEGLNAEFKKATSSIPSDLFETVVSFSNTDGGTLLLGVDDDGNVIGIDPAQKNKLLKNLVSSINSPDCIHPPLYLQPTILQLEDKIIIALQIPVSSQVHNHKGNIYIREFESDIDITKNQQRVSDLYHSKSNVFTESQIIPKLSLDDLEPELFVKVRNLIRSNKSDHPWLLMDNLSMLKESVLWRKDFITGQEGFTLAAALIFGKDTAIQSIVPAYKVESMVRIENPDRWDDRITLRTNLIDTYINLKSFINKYLPEKFYLEGDQRVDLRDKIFREVVGNSVVHREYRSALATEIIIDKLQLTATNPNKPHFNGPIDLESFNPFPKNPNIRKFFTALGWTDEIGSGIRNTKKYLPLYVNGAQPSFIEGIIFKTIIPLQLVTLGRFTDKWIKWLQLSEDYREHLEKSLNKIEVNPVLFNASWDDCLLQLVPGWNQKGTRLEKLDWPKNQTVEKDFSEKVPGRPTEGTGRPHKKIRYLISILSLAAEPLSLDDIMKAIGYANKKTFRDNYIKPLEQLQFITKTDLVNLSSPDQKYKLTKAGALFLGNQS